MALLSEDMEISADLCICTHACMYSHVGWCLDLSFQKERDTLMEITNRQCSKLHRLLDSAEGHGNGPPTKAVALRSGQGVPRSLPDCSGSGERFKEGVADCKLWCRGQRKTCTDFSREAPEEEKERSRRSSCLSVEEGGVSAPGLMGNNEEVAGQEAEREEDAMTLDTTPLEISGIPAFLTPQTRTGRLRGKGGRGKKSSEKR